MKDKTKSFEKFGIKEINRYNWNGKYYVKVEKL